MTIACAMVACCSMLSRVVRSIAVFLGRRHTRRQR
jgi:hypothetical protein